MRRRGSAVPVGTPDSPPKLTRDQLRAEHEVTLASPRRTYSIAWLLYAISPAWSYGLNTDFEDHAEHEYALFVQENPSLEQEPYDGLFVDAYGAFDSLADLFRQIGHDERVHKKESLVRMAEPRFR